MGFVLAPVEGMGPLDPIGRPFGPPQLVPEVLNGQIMVGVEVPDVPDGDPDG